MGKTKWKAFNIRMPIEIIPLYNFLQDEMNFLLSDNNSRAVLNNIDLSQHKGNIWIEMNNLFNDRINDWTIHNKAWHARILFENLRRELQSKYEAIKVWEELKINNFEINQQIFDNLIKKYKIYATRGTVSNIKSSGKTPSLTTKATFQLDYTVSDKQIFIKDEYNNCKIKVSKDEWLDYQIILPTSLHGGLTGDIAKPRFMKRKHDGKYIGLCSYKYNPKTPIGKNILGVDIGQVKLFSAIALDKKGYYGTEINESKKLQNMNIKLKKLYEEKQKLYVILSQNARLLVNTDKNNNRMNHYLDISNKIENLKLEIARNVGSEVAYTAYIEGCNIIHIENLTWMGSKGGKWNHAQTHDKIIESAEEYGIKVVKVNPAYSSSEHPITKEKGVKLGRNIIFDNKQKVDRDVLAAVNIAVRNNGKKKVNKLQALKKKHSKAKKVNRKSIKKEVKELINTIKKGNAEIVAFSPYVPSSNTGGVWSCLEQVLFNNSLLVRDNLTYTDLLHC